MAHNVQKLSPDLMSSVVKHQDALDKVPVCPGVHVHVIRFMRRAVATIRQFCKSHNTVHFGGLFVLKQWISSSLKHDTVQRVIIVYGFHVKNPPKRIALWEWQNSQ